MTGGRDTTSKWGGNTRQNFRLGSPSSGGFDASEQQDGVLPTLAEKILFQAMADFEKESDPNELYHIMDI